MPPPPYRDPWVARRQQQQSQSNNPEEMLEKLVLETIGGSPGMDLGFMKVRNEEEEEEGGSGWAPGIGRL